MIVVPKCMDVPTSPRYVDFDAHNLEIGSASLDFLEREFESEPPDLAYRLRVKRVSTRLVLYALRVDVMTARARKKGIQYTSLCSPRLPVTWCYRGVGVDIES
jgi:hypothetical protein